MQGWSFHTEIDEKESGGGDLGITFGSEKFEVTLRHKSKNVKEEVGYMRVKETNLG